MLSIGDLRNRLVALADESSRGNPEIYRLFCYRLSKQAGAEALRDELAEMISDRHPLVSAVPEPMRRIIRTHLRFFWEQAPPDFDLRGANIGNLMLTGGYVSQEHDIRSTLFLFSQLLEVRGTVLPTADSTAHLAARMSDGTTLVGQHRMTGKEVAPLTTAIDSMYLVETLDDQTPIEVPASTSALKRIAKADLICYPMGSFYTSVLANLLPRGVGSAVAAAGCPKIYIPSSGRDPERVGLGIEQSVERLLDVLRADCGGDVETRDLIDLVLVDTNGAEYEPAIDKARIEALGVSVVDAPLTDPRDEKPGLSAQLLAEALLSLGQ
jgi:CofD-related protein of GAK system